MCYRSAATFREAVITAYRGRCALSGLREPVLLDAAHIIEDKHERLGQPVVQNGIPLAKTHHAAFDAHLIGIDPDFKIHVSGRILKQKDGPTLEALKRLHENRIILERIRQIATTWVVRVVAAPEVLCKVRLARVRRRG